MVCQEPASLGLELPTCLYLCPRAPSAREGLAQWSPEKNKSFVEQSHPQPNRDPPGPATGRGSSEPC